MLARRIHITLFNYLQMILIYSKHIGHKVYFKDKIIHCLIGHNVYLLYLL